MCVNVCLCVKEIMKKTKEIDFLKQNFRQQRWRRWRRWRRQREKTRRQLIHIMPRLPPSTSPQQEAPPKRKVWCWVIVLSKLGPPVPRSCNLPPGLCCRHPISHRKRGSFRPPGAREPLLGGREPQGGAEILMGGGKSWLLTLERPPMSAGYLWRRRS